MTNNNSYFALLFAGPIAIVGRGRDYYHLDVAGVHLYSCLRQVFDPHPQSRAHAYAVRITLNDHRMMYFAHVRAPGAD